MMSLKSTHTAYQDLVADNPGAIAVPFFSPKHSTEGTIVWTKAYDLMYLVQLEPN